MGTNSRIETRKRAKHESLESIQRFLACSELGE